MSSPGPVDLGETSHFFKKNFLIGEKLLYSVVLVSAMKESEVTQLCPTLCDPMDCSLPGSSVHGIFQARILEWVATSFSRGSSRPGSPTLQADALPSEPPGKPGFCCTTMQISHNYVSPLSGEPPCPPYILPL